MKFQELVDSLVTNTIGTGNSLQFFLPEIVICATIVLLLLARLFGTDRVIPGYWVALSGTLVAFVIAFQQFGNGMTVVDGSLPESIELFSGLLVYDPFTQFFRVFLLLFLVLVISLTVLSGIPDNEDAPDFYTLLLGSTVGMMLMAEANHLLILFLGIEMTSVPSYAMVGFLKGRKKSSEAALKYVVYGAGAAGVMLYGISLLAGLLGTANLPEMASQLNALMSTSEGLHSAEVRTVTLALLMVFVGFAFKLSLVPFHFWCPDAFEGAPAEVAGFLSVASKAGAFALLVRFCLAIAAPGTEAAGSLTLIMGIGLGVIAALSTTYGNLAAYTQTNIKRMLAYSTIAHAGYMVMAVAALMIIQHGNQPEMMEQSKGAIAGLLFYLAVYLFMNLGAFAIVALIRNKIYSEEIDDYRGLASQAPALCVCMLICLFSLVGMPPFGGFFGKLYVFYSLFESGNVHWSMWVVLGVGGLNTVFSLFYYLRVLKAMFIDARPDGARSARIRTNSVSVFYAGLVTLPVVLFGVYGPLMSGLSKKSEDIAQTLLERKAEQRENAAHAAAETDSHSHPHKH